MQRTALFATFRRMLGLCTAAMLAAVMAVPAQAGPAAAAKPGQGLWPPSAGAGWHTLRPTPEGLADGVTRRKTRLRPLIFLGVARGVRIGAGAGFDGRGGNVRATVALELDF